MDTTGEQHLHIDHNIYKRRLDLNGKPIEEPKKTGNDFCNIGLKFLKINFIILFLSRYNGSKKNNR